MENSTAITECIAAQLRSAIAMQKMLKKDLAEKSGIPVISLSRYLNGHRDIPVTQLVAICNALGLDAGTVLNEAAK